MREHDRRSIRLPTYDYNSPGYYYLTICTADRLCVFGQIEDKKMVLNEIGKIADRRWRQIPFRFPNVKLDVYVIMPNHIHGIVQIMDNDAVGAIHESPLHGLERR
ncbi:MAG: hypothetical protein PHW53_02995 [Patescibacteria group bacterium]|nr:hypothetical protein [Patescibacteria group bacterium]